MGKLAFLRGGDIWVKELPDGEERRLTRDGRNIEPRWSASGEWLAFRKDDQIWVMRAAGAGARALNGIAQGDVFAWSPAEDRLAYTKSRGLRVEDAGGSGRSKIVSGVDAVGSPTQPRGVTAIAWSPDGQWIAFEKRDYAPPQPVRSQGLWQAKADGSMVEEVYLNPDPSRAHSYLSGWSPDGQRMVYLNNGCEGGDWDIYTMVADGSSRKRLTNMPKVLKERAIWSPTGAGIAFSTLKEIMVVDANSEQVRTLATRGDGSSSALHLHDSPWSPDGRYIVIEVSGGHSLCFTGKE